MLLNSKPDDDLRIYFVLGWFDMINELFEIIPFRLLLLLLLLFIIFKLLLLLVEYFIDDFDDFYFYIMI